MQELQQIKQDILSRGKVDSDHLAALHRRLYADGAIGRPEADFLVELHKRVEHQNPAFDRLFYKAIKDHVLTTGRIDAEETAWLRRTLFADGTIKDEERKCLHELKGEAREVSAEFDILFREAMKSPPERHTSG